MRKILAVLIMTAIRILTMTLSPSKKSELFRRLRARLIAEYSIYNSKGGRISLDIGNYCHSYKIPEQRHGEPDTISWIESMPRDAVLWDIGANVGFFSLYAASLLYGDGMRVIAFEPAAANYSALNRNIEINAMDDRVSAYCISLTSTTRIGKLHMGGIVSTSFATAAGAAFNSFETELDQMGRNINPVFRQGSVGFSIDDFVEMSQPPLPTHIKMDVDGIEAEILRGGRRTLSARSVCSMIVEMEQDLNSDHNRELFGLMEELGFVPRPKQSPELRNVIFERPA